MSTSTRACVMLHLSGTVANNNKNWQSVSRVGPTLEDTDMTETPEELKAQIAELEGSVGALSCDSQDLTLHTVLSDEAAIVRLTSGDSF